MGAVSVSTTGNYLRQPAFCRRKSPVAIITSTEEDTPSSQVGGVYKQNNTFITAIDPFHHTIYIYIFDILMIGSRRKLIFHSIKQKDSPPMSMMSIYI